jgi:hypothetical protein
MDILRWLQIQPQYFPKSINTTIVEQVMTKNIITAKLKDITGLVLKDCAQVQRIVLKHS